MRSARHPFGTIELLRKVSRMSAPTRDLSRPIINRKQRHGTSPCVLTKRKTKTKCMKTIKNVTAKLMHEMVRIARFALGMLDCAPRSANLAKAAQVASLLGLGAIVPASAQSTQATATALPVQATCPSKAPAFPQMRYDEDNRYFSDPNCRTEFLDRLKFIPLRGESEDYYISFGVLTRDRGEYFSNPDWGSGCAPQKIKN